MAKQSRGVELCKLNDLLTTAVVSSTQDSLTLLCDLFKNKEINRNYFPEDYELMASLMGQEITSNAVTNINEALYGLITWLLSFNRIRIVAANERDYLHNLLQPKLKTSAWLVVTIQKDACSAVGVFLLAANLHLIFLQQIRNVDPTCRTIYHSNYQTKAFNFVNFYSGYVTKQYNQIIKVRLGIISANQGKHTVNKSTDALDANQMRVTFACWWDDLLTGDMDIQYAAQTLDANTDLETIALKWLEMDATKELLAKVECSRNQYIHEVLEQLRVTLNNPEETLKMWRQINWLPVLQQTTAEE